MAHKHTCNEGRGPVFGRKTPGCIRCDALLAGAPPIQWRSPLVKEMEQRRIAEIRAHNCRVSRCGPVCTAFDY